MSYVSDFLHLDIDGIKICLVKYGSVDEKVDLLLFSLNEVKPNLEVEAGELEKPHRLWTLIKIADRNARGTDRLIANIINKLTLDDLPFYICIAIIT